MRQEAVHARLVDDPPVMGAVHEALRAMDAAMAALEGRGSGDPSAARLGAVLAEQRRELGRLVEELEASGELVGEAVEASRRVLVVDDNPDALETMALLLEMYGHEVATAADGVRAVEVARSFRPEVMFLDLGLPGRDGYEVGRMIRREFPPGTLWLVALSGYGQEEDRRRTREIGFDQHLVKPADPAAIAEAMRGR